MEQLRATREQAKFFRHEQRSLRLRADTPRSLKAISWLYEVTSDYGESPIRPLACVGVVFLFFFVFYSLILKGGVCPPVLADLTSATGWADAWAFLTPAVRFAVHQVFAPFRIFIGNPPAPLGLALLAAVHSLLNISFVALFIIALRRKFRLV